MNDVKNTRLGSTLECLAPRHLRLLAKVPVCCVCVSAMSPLLLLLSNFCSTMLRYSHVSRSVIESEVFVEIEVVSFLGGRGSCPTFLWFGPQGQAALVQPTHPEQTSIYNFLVKKTAAAKQAI